MNAQELSQSKARTKVLSNVSDPDRLLRIMSRWWIGWSWEQIAQEHGVSRQRVGKLLAQVGCTRALWLRADHRRASATRRVLASQAAVARDALLHRCAGRLTRRQRAALAWRALGLGSVDTARRMATTPNSVRNLLVAARWRLERLSRPQRRKRAGQRVQRGGCDMVQPASDVGIPIEWDRLLDGIDAPRSPVNKRDGNGGTARGNSADRRHVGARRERGGCGARLRRSARGQRRCGPGPTRASRARRAASD